MKKGGAVSLAIDNCRTKIPMLPDRRFLKIKLRLISPQFQTSILKISILMNFFSIKNLGVVLELGGFLHYFNRIVSCRRISLELLPIRMPNSPGSAIHLS